MRTNEELANALKLFNDVREEDTGIRNTFIDEAARRLQGGDKEERIEGWVIDERVNARGQGRTIEFKTGPVRSWPDAIPATLILDPPQERTKR